MSRYAVSHIKPEGAGDSRPTALQIVRDEGLENKLVGKVVVITGATSGIGLETARALSATGATLFLTARDLPKAKTCLHDILESDLVSLVEMDNTSVASVRNAAATILEKSNGMVNILINNAGIMGITNLTLTEDQHEIHFAVNYLSHFLLFQLLRPALLASATSDFSSRVVNVSSSAHRAGNLDHLVNYNFEDGKYDDELAYSNSKLATVYMANEIDRRYGNKGLHATSLHPGGINTNISRHIGPEFVAQLMTNSEILKILKSAEQGAATTVIAAIGKDWEGKGGKYLEDCEEAKRGPDDNNVFGVGWVRQTYNPETEGRLWRDSLKVLGMSNN
jgi:NAD(P)-dependent dehydrogenase (short-subunit alcohol dehydrogenase family)